MSNIVLIIIARILVRSKIRKIWHILPISRLYRLLPLLTSPSQLDDDDDDVESAANDNDDYEEEDADDDGPSKVYTR